jgi:hypothetical protein
MIRMALWTYTTLTDLAERAGGLLEWSYDLPKTLRAGRYVALATGGAEPIQAARNSNSFRLVDFPG